MNIKNKTEITSNDINTINEMDQQLDITFVTL